MRDAPMVQGLAALAASLGLAGLVDCGGPEIRGDSPVGAGELEVGTRPAAERIGSVDGQLLALRIHERVNDIRRRNGLRALAWNGALVAIAAGHSQDMKERKYFAHVSPTGEDFSRRYQRGGFTCRVPVAPGKYLTGGENLAQVHQVVRWIVWGDGRREPGQVRSLDELAEATVTGWWNSPPHKENLLRAEWQSEAIGIAVAADGTVWVTQNFC